MQDTVSLIDRYTFKAGERLIVDTSVWLSIEGPQGNPHDRRAVAYSGAFARMIKAKVELFVDVGTLSEFINRYSRMMFQIRRSSDRTITDYKPFRDSVDFKPIAADIAGAVRRILRDSKAIDTPFTTMPLEATLTDFETRCSDFNDDVLVHLCRQQNLALVTDDADFAGCGIPVITANRRLLTAST